MIFQLRQRSLQSKATSFLILATIILTPLTPAYAAFGTGGPTVPNSTVFTADTEMPKVDGSTGAFTQRMPLDIPPGRNGLQPDVTLDYNSQRTQDSIVGYGWALSIPYIERLNKTGSQNLYGGTPYFTSSIEGELASAVATIPAAVATTSPTILDTLNLTQHSTVCGITSDSFSYTVPSNGSNKLLLAIVRSNSVTAPTSATQNGTSLASFTRIPGSSDRGEWYYSYLAAPTTGTFQINFASSICRDIVLMTLQNAAQTASVDVSAVANSLSASSETTSTTTTVGNDLLISVGARTGSVFTSYGAGETEITNYGINAFGDYVGGSWKSASSSRGSESTTGTGSGNVDIDWAIMAVKAISTAAIVSTSTQYRARIDTGSNTTYSFTNNTWIAYDKKGTKYTYGSDDTGRMYDTGTGTSTQTARWYLQEVRDTNGNYIKYTYNRDSNVLYPYQIIYTGHNATDGNATISFATSTRTDTRVSYATDFVATTTKRISEIDASVNGSIVRKYLLGYGTGNNGYRSLLASVQQQGYDENNNLVSLPATTFSYENSNFQFYAPANVVIADAAYIEGDTDGDGIVDSNVFMPGAGNGLMFHDSSGSTTNVPNGSTPPPEWWANGPSPYSAIERGVRYLDINGDGRAEVVRGWVDNAASTSDYAIYYNQYATSTGAYGWAATSTSYNGTIPAFAENTGSLTLTGGLFGDVNGDGLPDYTTAVAGTFASTTYLGNGSAWDATTTTFVPAKGFPSTAPTETGSQLVDINGDGLDDWVYSSGGNTYVLLNNGNGWATTPDPHWTIATSTLYSSGGNYYDRGMRFIDLNGDGLPDFVRAYQVKTGSICTGPEFADVKAVYLNTGYGWAISSAYTLPAYITNCTSGFLNDEYVNFNGNGQLKQDVLSTVTYSKGGSLAVTYASSTSMSGNAGSPVEVLVASKVTTNDNRGNYATTTYGYSGASWYLGSDVRDRRFAGFSPVIATTTNSVTASYYGQGTLSQIGRPIRTDVYDLSSVLEQSTFNRWDTSAHGDGTFVGLGQQVVQTYGSDGTHRDRATAYSYSTSTDDLLTATDYGEVTGNSDGTFTDIAGDTRTTNFSYAASSSVNMSEPTEKTLLDTNGATSSDQKLYYDSLSFGSVSVGNNTKQEDWVSGTKYASSTKTYNSYGSVATSTDRNGNATSFIYDAYNLYVATSTNPLLQKTEFYYNYSNGKVKKSSDPNARLTKNIFDGIGRLTETDVSSTSTPTTYATTTTYVYADATSTLSSIKRTDWLFPANTIDTFDYYDGLDRLIQERKNSQTSNVYAVTDRVYDGVGNLASSSLPYFSSGSSNTMQTSIAGLYTNYFYDGLQRVTKISDSIGIATKKYYKWTTTTTDPNGNIKDVISDPFGNIATVVEHLSPSSGTTTYTYDAQNNLSTTTDALGNVRHFTYDGLGRRLTAEDLHASSDGTYGTSTYTYDDQGNLISQTDPKGQVINRTYDALNRMTTEDYTGAAGTEVTLTYDSCTNGIGLVCIASSTSAKTSNSYDILGRVSSATTTISNISYNMSYSYDRQSNITSLTYPNGSQAAYNYNIAGLLSRIQHKASGGSFSDIISNYDYAPQAQILNVLFGNNASTTYFYDASAMYRLSNLQTKSGSTSIQKFAYTYDNNGNITQIANTASSTAAAVTAFTYDALNRLLTASTLAASSSPYAETFTYDLLGNILTSTYATGTQLVTVSPTITDTLNLTAHSTVCGVTSDSFSYTVPSGGSNKMLFAVVRSNSVTAPTSATQNGTGFASFTRIPGSSDRGEWYYSYLAAPTTGTFQINFASSVCYDVALMTLKDAAQSSPVDAYAVSNSLSAPSETTSTTTTVGNDVLVSIGARSNSAFTSYGTSESEITNYGITAFGDYVGGSWRAAASSAGSESTTGTGSGNSDIDWAITAIKAATVLPHAVTTNTNTYAGTGYANPDAPTQIAYGLSTTTFTYDNNGNVTQKTVDGTTTTYVYDYANRLTALGVGGATTSYAYDWQGNRVSQTGTSTTWLYPFKWYSIASSTGTGAKYSTTTEYVFNGDTLVSTIDQQLAGGVATGSAKTRFIHPDHLGSTNVVTDASGTVSETLDYYPYGATRISTGQSNESRQYIGQFSDQSTLSYLNARYYDSSRGQFLSQDPLFVGDPRQQNIQDPQSLNSYSYSEDNPITGSDPSGRCGPVCVGLLAMFAPQAAGDPVFNFNGSISSTPQQTTIGAVGFAGQLVSDTEELSALSAARSKFTTSIEVNGGVDEVTNLPYAIPSRIGGKIIFGGMGIVGLLAIGEDYFKNSTEAGNDFGGLATYNLMPHPVMVNGLTPYFNGGPGPTYLYAPGNLHTACGLLCLTPVTGNSPNMTGSPGSGPASAPAFSSVTGSTGSSPVTVPASGSTGRLPGNYHTACGTLCQ